MRLLVLGLLTASLVLAFAGCSDSSFSVPPAPGQTINMAVSDANDGQCLFVTVMVSNDGNKTYDNAVIRPMIAEPAGYWAEITKRGDYNAYSFRTPLADGSEGMRFCGPVTMEIDGETQDLGQPNEFGEVFLGTIRPGARFKIHYLYLLNPVVK